MKHRRFLSILIIGMSCITLKALAEEQEQRPDRAPAVVNTDTGETDGEYPEEPVIKEVRPFVWDNTTHEYRTPYYRDRKRHWGAYLSGGINLFNPQVVKDQRTVNGQTVQYKGAVPGTIMVQLSPRYGTKLGSISLDLAYAQYSIDTTDSSGANMTVAMPHAGITIVLDTLMREPYFAPYVSGGVYRAEFKQWDNSGQTAFVGYYAAGGLFQLNWMDRTASEKAYEESGLENAYIYAEWRVYTASASEDPNFSSSSGAAGLRIEF